MVERRGLGEADEEGHLGDGEPAHLNVALRAVATYVVDNCRKDVPSQRKRCCNIRGLIASFFSDRLDVICNGRDGGAIAWDGGGLAAHVAGT